MGRSLILCTTLALTVMLSGCAEQFAVSNQTNNLSIAGQAAGKGGSESWTWKNTVGSAQVSWGGQAAEGRMTLKIEDAAGKQVFSRSLSGTSQEGFDGPTSSGAPGDWKVTLRFDDFTGQMGLSIRAGGSSGTGGWGGGFTP